MNEIRRVLKPSGILILTAPDPFWERIATLVGHLPDEQHQMVMNLNQLCELTNEAGFTTLCRQKFMLSPIGMPFEFQAEKIVRLLKLDFLMANQLLVVKA